MSPWGKGRTRIALALAALALVLAFFPAPALAKKKKKEEPAKTEAPPKPQIDTSKLVWPEPPNIARVKYLDYFAGEKLDTTPASEEKKPKRSWMDRLAGVEASERNKLKAMPFQLLGPQGMALDSKGNLYVADQKVGGIFVFNTDTREAGLIGGNDARFALANAIAIDDDDRMFITDGKLHRVLVFNPKHEVVDQIRGGLIDPVGIAIDPENRLLYVADTQQDQVLVFDADSLKELRRLGKQGKLHEQTAPGDFAAPMGVAVDDDGNVYVTDMLNNRVEIFDADGNFISLFGRHCDGPGCFARPKGIAVDGDGHIWVADPMLDLLQVFNRDGQLLAFIGGHGKQLGQFSSLTWVAFDRKRNRIFTAEQYPGRVQEFQYVTDAEAEQLAKEKEARRAARAAKEHAPAAQSAESSPAKAEGKQP